MGQSATKARGVVPNTPGYKTLMRRQQEWTVSSLWRNLFQYFTWPNGSQEVVYGVFSVNYTVCNYGIIKIYN